MTIPKSYEEKIPCGVGGILGNIKPPFRGVQWIGMCLADPIGGVVLAVRLGYCFHSNLDLIA